MLSAGVIIPLLGAVEGDGRSWWHWLVLLGGPTVTYILFLMAVWWARRRVIVFINRQMADQVRRVAPGQLRRVSMQHLVQLTRTFFRLIFGLLVLGGLFLWLTAVLDALPTTHQWARHIEESMVQRLEQLAQSVLLALPGLGIVVILFFIVRVVHAILSHYFRLIEDGELESEAFDPVTAQTTRRLTGVGLWVAAIIIAYPYIPGSETSAFKGVTILAGLMLSLGSTNLVGQLVSGLVLIYSRAVRPGDAVIVGDAEGTVEELGLFSSAIRTPDEQLIWLPNSALASGVRNNSRAGSGAAVRLTTQVTIGYDTPWRQVRELLLAAATKTDEVRREPAPFVRQVALEDFYVRYELVFAPADPARRKVVLSALHEAIQDEFQAAGVQIMSPHYLGDPAGAKIPPAPGKP